MKLIAAAAGGVAEPFTEEELDALVEDTFTAVAGDFTDPGRTEAVAAAATCCWFRGKMKAGPC